ncbi:MAG: DNA polymerase III subunit alpha [Candidatus Omnitrophota bacterium]
MHSDFVHLHVHTQYSLLDGACLIRDLVRLASVYRMPALAMTDHGNLFGAIEFYEAAQNAGVKPIVGCEVYVAADSRFEKSSRGIKEGSFHLTLLAKDEKGYKNLIKLVSTGYLEGFYYRPRIDMEVLAQYNEGLIGLSGCLHGEIPHLMLTGQGDKAKELALKFSDILGKGNFYLEVMDHLIPEQRTLNSAFVEMSKDMNLPLVATNDVHYLAKEHSRAHEALLCIGTQTMLDDPNRLKFQTDEFYFKTADEMKKIFSELPEAIKNTREISEKCNLEMNFKKTHLPHFHPPQGKTRDDYLKELVKEGLKTRYPAADENVHKRLEHELGVIKSLGYTSYFLIVWDFVRYAKEKSIPVGPGRGSAAGSIVSYCLGITDIDPLKYDLLFERFLNIERISLPDIDIDFCDEKRDEVINYVIGKYGKDNVAQIVTFGTMGAKAVIRDVARVMNFSYAEADRIAKLVPTDLNITLEEAIAQEAELRNLYKNDIRVTQLIDTAKVLEGLTRHASMHAAGVVISEKPLTEYIPLYKTGDDQITTGYPMGSVEKVGLLKMDFLGLKTLAVLDESAKIIKRTRNTDIDISKISLHDKKTYELLSRAESQGVFQLESSGMRDLLRKLQPTQFEDLIALLALFRPGPIGSGMVENFIERKHGRVKIAYDHPALEPILNNTYGVCIYQEQVMRIVSALAGFSMAKADELRRAISKKIPEVIEVERNAFIIGCHKNAISKTVADKIFDQIEYFAGYGFNKSHAAAYALISYRTAYLKANYPIEFMAALLSSERNNTDKIAQYIDEAERMGIKVLPPDINESYGNFTVVGDGIRFGLTAVKNVGGGAVDSIIQARQKLGKFKSIYEFSSRVDVRLVNRKVLESLIKCGAFDTFGLRRSQLVAVLDRVLEMASSLHRDRSIGQLSLFDAADGNGLHHDTVHVPDIKEWPETQLLAFEKEMLGFYVTGHPLAKYERTLRTYASTSSAKLAHCQDGEEVTIGGIIAKAKHTVTKRTSEKMAIVTLEDIYGDVEVLVFPSTYQKVSANIIADRIVLVKGRTSLREDAPKIIASDIIALEDAIAKNTKALTIQTHNSSLGDKNLEELGAILKGYEGKVPVFLKLKTPQGRIVKVKLGDEFTIKPDERLFTQLEELFGEGAVMVDS